MKSVALPGTRVKAGKLEASVKVGTGRASQTSYKRFSLDTPASEILDWQESERKRLREILALPESGTLAEDVARFLKSIPNDPNTSPPNKRRLNFKVTLAPWVKALGAKRRLAVTADDCRKVLDSLPAEYAASTRNKIRQALISLYNHLDGEDATCPASKLSRYREPDPERRAVDYAALRQVIADMDESVSQARLGLLLATGARPVEIGRLTRESFSLDGETPSVYFPACKQGHARYVPLTPEGVKYAQLFIRLQAFGLFSNSSLGTSLRRAWIKADKPAGMTSDEEKRWEQTYHPQRGVRRRYRVTPYVLRHTVLTELRRTGTDLADVAALAGHRSAQTTARYAPVISDKLAAAVRRLAEVQESAEAGTPAGEAGNRLAETPAHPVVQ